MIIGLFGFSFIDRNRGCEALTYSFINILQELYPEKLTIVNLSGSDISKVSKMYPKIKFEMVGFQKDKISVKSFTSLMKCDYVFDCTFGDNFSDIYDLGFVSRTTNYKELTLFLKKKLILAPQTIGPFKNEKLKRRVKKVLRKSALVYSRDTLTTNYVKELSGVDAITVTDLAFLLPYEKSNKNTSDKMRVGVNVSGLLWSGGFDRQNQFGLSVNYQEYIKSLIEQIQANGYEIHLIPHVFSDEKGLVDEDFKICKMLSEQYYCKFAGYLDNPIDAKSYIANMDVFIGARMHSTVAAFSSGVVTIPFSYSRKFEGLYNSVGYNYLINAREMSTKDALNTTMDYIQKRDELRSQQIQAMKKINALEKVFIDSLKKYLKL